MSLERCSSCGGGGRGFEVQLELRHTDWEAALWRLIGSHQRRGHRHPHLSSHDLQEDPHSAIVIEMLEFPDEVAQRPGGYSDCLPFLQVEVELDVPFWIGSRSPPRHGGPL